MRKYALLTWCSLTCYTAFILFIFFFPPQRMNVNLKSVYHISAKAKRMERIHEPLSYLYLPFVMSERWSKIAWCCVPHCQRVTALVGCQRCQEDTGCTTGILNSLLNIPSYQWQASTGEYAFNGRRDTSQRNSQTGDTGRAAGGFWACRSVVFSVWNTERHYYSSINDVLKKHFFTIYPKKDIVVVVVVPAAFPIIYQMEEQLLLA